MRWNKGLLLAFALAASVVAYSQSPVLVHRQKYAMGTVFEIASYGASSGALSSALDEALQEAVRLDQIMSDYRADSELSRLNRGAFSVAQAVSPDLYRVIEIALEYSKLSGGRFDITVGPLAAYWKSVMRGERARSAADESKLRGCVGYGHVILRPPDRVEFRCPSTRIDLGAIGKGFAVDRIVEVLRRRGVSNALVNAGGSTLYGMGHPPGEGAWRVVVKDMGDGKTQVLLSEDSLSTSKQSAPSMLGDRKSGHLVDPLTGEPVATSMTVAVLARTATDSDALSTALLLVGTQRATQLITDSSALGALWISSTGQLEVVSKTPVKWLADARAEETPLEQKAQR